MSHLSMNEEAPKDHKVIPIEDGDDHELQSSPRGVLEIAVSGTDSDYQSSSLCSRGSSFNEKSPATEGDADSAIDSGGDDDDGGGRAELYSPSSVMRWRNLVYSLKCKSFKMFSVKRLGLRQNDEETIAVGDWAVQKPSWRNFTFEELAAATDNFSHDNLVGRGGHAEVYKGCLPDGQLVAVKKITKKGKKDEDRVGDFLSELGIIAHINHPNAARLIGFSSDTDLHLVLQFAPHGSLATLLHNGEERLEWALRLKVAKGIAEGLQYLHCECQRRIIHRDITASNILLMEDYQPRASLLATYIVYVTVLSFNASVNRLQFGHFVQISDFGLAKWLPDKWVHHIVFPVEGTFGYMAPEYFMHGIVHEKIDVFSFGVLLLELITGRRAVDSSRQSLVIWAKPLLEQSNIKELVDPHLENNYEITELKRTMSAASACLHHMPNMRPNMKQVIQMLKGEKMTTEPKQKTGGGRAILLDACDLDDYTCTTYLKDLNRHIELVMEL